MKIQHFTAGTLNLLELKLNKHYKEIYRLSFMGPVHINKGNGQESA